MNIRSILILLLCTSLFAAPGNCAEVDYHQHIAPILEKYCVSCHADEEPEGKLSLESYASLMKGGSRGAAVAAGHPELSRLVRMITGQAKPVMPPDDAEAPNAEEIALLVEWIKAGAKGPEGDPPPKVLVTPTIEPEANVPRAINDLSLDPAGRFAAYARYGQVELVDRANGKPLSSANLGKTDVNVLHATADGSLLAAGGGVPGLRGEVHVWKLLSSDAHQLAEHRTWTAHDDTIYAIAFSPDGKLLATGGYDRKIKIWNLADAKLLHTFTTHNDTIYDLAFHPGGRILASASADFTVKLWDAIEGKRLDTLGQSTKELYAVAFHPNGKQVAAAGVDNRIRVWSVSDDAREGSNPLAFSRFAHEEPVLRLAYTPNGRLLISAAEDRLVKVWDAASMRLQTVLTTLEDWPSGMAVSADGKQVTVAMRNGSVTTLSLEKLAALEVDATPLPEITPSVSYGPQPPIAELPRVEEIEPNDAPAEATELEVPSVAKGVIHAEDRRDRDLYRFTAKAGDWWIIETNAARSKSPLDSQVEVLHADGTPVVRLILRAVRDSELQFRGATSQARGFRLKNWEEMLLNQFIYVGGDVMKHLPTAARPRRRCSNVSRGRQPLRLFRHHSPGACLGGAGLCGGALSGRCQASPTTASRRFRSTLRTTIESKQRMGKDSKLTFTAPADGNYLIAVSDVRGFSGSDFRYDLVVRRPVPDYTVSLGGGNPTLNAGGGKNFTVKVNRRDGFEGEVTVTIADPPEGYYVTSPITIEAGLTQAHGVLYAAADASPPADDAGKQMTLAASAMIDGEQVERAGGNFGMIKLADKAKIRTYLEPVGSDPKSAPTVSEGFPEQPVLEIAPGTTVTCRLRIEREGFGGRVSFDVNNLPHGVIVDNIGLSGVLMPAGESERIIYLTAEPWVAPTKRLFHAVAKAEGNQASLPMLLKVK